MIIFNILNVNNFVIYLLGILGNFNIKLILKIIDFGI